MKSDQLKFKARIFKEHMFKAHMFKARTFKVSAFKVRTFLLTLIPLMLITTMGNAQADTDELVGTWERISGARAITGTMQNKSQIAPVIDGTDGLKSIRIEKQKDGAFYGKAQLMNGDSSMIAGALRNNKKNFVMSGDVGHLSGTIEDQVMDVCFTTILPEINIAACYVLKKIN